MRSWYVCTTRSKHRSRSSARQCASSSPTSSTEVVGSNGVAAAVIGSAVVPRLNVPHHAAFDVVRPNLNVLGLDGGGTAQLDEEHGKDQEDCGICEGGHSAWETRPAASPLHEASRLSRPCSPARPTCRCRARRT